MSVRFRLLFLSVLSLVLAVRPDSKTASNDDNNVNTPPKVPNFKLVGAKHAVSYEENVGQTNAEARFIARQPGMSVFLTDSGAKLSVSRPTKRDQHGKPLEASQAAVDLSVAGARVVQPKASEAQVTKTNYFVGRDSSKWHTNVASYGKVTYPGILDGVDLVFHGDNGSIEYDFVVAPGTNVDTVAMNVSGGDVSLNDKGDLTIHTSAGDLVQARPVVYQRDESGKKQLVQASYRIKEDKRIAFEVAAYDHARPLVIDPTIAFITYLGGAEDDHVNGVAADSFQATYVVGWTFSADFPKTTAQNFHPTICQKGGQCLEPDVFVAKYDATGVKLWATLFGGREGDEGLAIAVDTGNRPHITGQTYSDDLPTSTGVLNEDKKNGQGNADAFAARFSDTGILERATYLAGEQHDVGNGIAVDGAGNEYITGATISPDFTIPPPQQPPQQQSIGQDSIAAVTRAFVVKLNPTQSARDPAFNGGNVAYLTGNGNFDYGSGNGIVLDSNLRINVVGEMNVTLLNQTGAVDTCDSESYNAFVVQLSPTGTTNFASCLSGILDDYGAAVAVDASNMVYVTGWSDSTGSQGGSTGGPAASGFPTTSGALMGDLGSPAGRNAFVTKLDPSLGSNAIIYSTLLGGSGSDDGRGIAVDATGGAWVIGRSSSNDFPQSTPSLKPPGFALDADDIFLTYLNVNGTEHLFSTLYGTDLAHDVGNGIAVTSTSVHVGGYTSAPGLPLGGTFPSAQSQLNGTAATSNQDGWLAKISIDPLLIFPPLVTVQPQQTQQFTSTGGAGLPHVFSFAQNNSGGTITPQGLYTAGTTGGVGDIVRVTDPAGNVATAQVTVGFATTTLTIFPTNASTPPRGTRSFVASGGTPPYTFGFVSNASGGTITANGQYTAGIKGQVTDIVRVTDASLQTATATVTVTPAITITPASPAVASLGNVSFSATGGSGTGFSWAITKNGSSGTINAQSGAYSAGPGSSTVDTVTVTDSLGNKASVNVSVGGGLAVTPADPTTTTRGTVTFTVVGGQQPYTFSVSTNASGASVDANGVYRAGDTGNVVDTVRVEDSNGNSTGVLVTVGPGLTITPANSNVAAGAQINFSAAGGSGEGYTYTIAGNQSGATINNGAYVAGQAGGIDTITLTDSLGAAVNATVNVTAAPPANPGGPGASSSGTTSSSSGVTSGINIGGGGTDDCSCSAVGASSSNMSNARILAGLALAFGLVARRRRRSS